MLRIVLLLLGLLGVLGALWVTRADAPERRRRLKRAVVAVVLLGALLLLVRLGQVRLAALGAFLLAAMRFLLPLVLRLVPWFLSRRANVPPREPSQPQGGPGSPAATRLSRAEALEILGLTEGATDEQIRRAHAELIKKVHPDRGGTSYLASRVNLARDLLLTKERR